MLKYLGDDLQDRRWKLLELSAMEFNKTTRVRHVTLRFIFTREDQHLDLASS